MKKTVLCLSLTFLFNFICLTAFGGHESLAAEKVKLIANFATGSPTALEDGQIKSKEVMIDKLTVENLAKELSNWTGHDFIINNVDMSDNAIKVDWSAKSTLISNAAPSKMIEEFHFYDVDSMRWFMMDSLYETILANFGEKEVYYSMDGGKELVFEYLYANNVFPIDIQYMGSPFYYAHFDVVGDDGELPYQLAVTRGIWRMDNATDTAYIDMPGDGSFTAYYASGSVEKDGYLTFEDSFYSMIGSDDELFAQFYFNSNDVIVFPNLNDRKYYKDLSVFGYDFPLLIGAKDLMGLIPFVSENNYKDGYLYSSLTPDGGSTLTQATYKSDMEANENINQYLERALKEINPQSELRDIKITPNQNYSAKMTYPVNLVTWVSGYNEDTRYGVAYMFLTDTHTYAFAFETSADFFEDMESIYYMEFDKLVLE